MMDSGMEKYERRLEDCGWEATRLIKANPDTRQIPIIALTAHALASDRDTSVKVGCADFDTKPVDLPRLLGKIRGCRAA